MRLGRFRLLCFVLHFWRYHYVRHGYRGFKIGTIVTYYCPKCHLYRDVKA